MPQEEELDDELVESLPEIINAISEKLASLIAPQFEEQLNDAEPIANNLFKQIFESSNHTRVYSSKNIEQLK